MIYLSADAFGVLPPVSILNHEQAQYYASRLHRAKLAGTERGIARQTRHSRHVSAGRSSRSVLQNTPRNW